MKTTLLLILLFVAQTYSLLKAQDPNITFTTDYLVGSNITFELTANAPNSSVDVDFGDGQKKTFSIGTTRTSVSGTLETSQTVKLYGANIKAYHCFNKQITALDVSKCLTLDSLSCHSNMLTALDLSANVALKYLDCNFNQIASLDVSKNVELINLDCSRNQLNSLDVTNNTKLEQLICNSNPLKVLNVTQNVVLEYLDCYYNSLSVLDLSKNVKLSILRCNGNSLTTIDLSKNVELGFLWINNNKLTSLDLTDNTKIGRVDCSNNEMNYATLPVLSLGTVAYFMAPQALYAIDANYSTNDAIDLSSQLTAGGKTTSYIWKTESGGTLVEGDDYNISNGVTTFLKAPSEKVFCDMHNASFPVRTDPYVLKTSLTTISIATGIDQVGSNALLIYAADQKIVVESPFALEIAIFDTMGRLVLSDKLQAGKSEIAVPNNGIYLAKVQSNSFTKVKKIAVN